MFDKKFPYEPMLITYNYLLSEVHFKTKQKHKDT